MIYKSNENCEIYNIASWINETASLQTEDDFHENDFSEFNEIDLYQIFMNNVEENQNLY